MMTFAFIILALFISAGVFALLKIGSILLRDWQNRIEISDDARDAQVWTSGSSMQMTAQSMRIE